MPIHYKREWIKKYPGVYSVPAKHSSRPGKEEQVFFISYRIHGKGPKIEEKAGKQYRDSMTPAKASALRILRIEGKDLPNRDKRAKEKARREAERAAREAEANRWTFNRLWTSYVDHHPGLKGRAQDASRFRLYLSPSLGEKVPEEVDNLSLARLRKTLQEEGKSPATVKHILVLIRRLSNFARESGLGPGLPFKVKVPKVNNETTEYLNEGQREAFHRALDADPCQEEADILRLALLTGMRKGELFRLKWADVDLGRGFLTLRNPKGGEDATIRISNAARDVLGRHPGREGSEYVFPGRYGQQRTECRAVVDRIRKAAKLPDGFRPMHGLRHTFASTLASSGQVDLYTLQTLLTHKDPKTTQRYAHLIDGALSRAANVAGDLLSRAKAKGGTK